MKKRVLLIVLGAMFFALPLTAQESWVRFYEAEEWEEMSGQCVIQTADGGYAIYAYFYEYGVGEKVWLLMTSPHGDTLWTKKYENQASWGSDALIESADGSCVLTGAGYTGESYDVWLCKAGAYCDVIWERHVDLGKGLDEYGRSIQQTTDGGYIITGRTYDLNLNKSDVLLIKTDARGDTVWTHTYEQGGASVSQTADGGCMLACNFGSYPYEFGLLKTNSLGQEEWRRIYDGTGGGWGMEQTTDAGYILTAVSAIIKTDSAGDVEWTRDFVAECARQTTDGGYILGGIAGTKLIKLDPDGNTLWEKIREFHIYSVRQTTDGGYILTGGPDVWLVKTDSTGYAPKLSGIAEPVPVTHHSNWEVVNSVGSRITLRYVDYPQGFTAFIFDATGRKVDEVHSSLTSGCITWGEGCGAGVYFIVAESDIASTQKVLLIR